ncbi:MAG: hypothetical protein J6333_00155, partial [Planctomycetes bacterium]|nr:hypothetical protein [Planctomycetota bacterium]
DEDLGRPLGFGDTNRCFPYEDWNGVNVTNLGVVGAYHWDDQFIVKAGIMASEWELPGQGFDSRLTYANATRNVGVSDHVIAGGWNPCWLEGLHLEASYMGRFDEGRGVNLPIEGNPYANDYTQVRSGDHSYRPSFDLGFNYRVNDCWRVYGEGLMVVNPFWGDGSNFALTLGVDYRVTDKLSLGFGFDYFHARYGAEYYFNATHDDDDDGCWGSGALYENVYRFGLGAKYDFSRGIYLQAQYYHAIGYVSGIDDQRAHDADVFLFQTGYKF